MNTINTKQLATTAAKSLLIGIGLTILLTAVLTVQGAKALVTWLNNYADSCIAQPSMKVLIGSKPLMLTAFEPEPTQEIAQPRVLITSQPQVTAQAIAKSEQEKPKTQAKKAPKQSKLSTLIKETV
jgi:hypothetical protein